MTENIEEIIKNADRSKIPGQVTPEMLNRIVKGNVQWFRDMARRFGITPESIRAEKNAKKELLKIWKRALVNKKGEDPLIYYLHELPRKVERDIKKIRKDFYQWKEDFKIYLLKEGTLTWDVLLELPSAFNHEPDPHEYSCEKCGSKCLGFGGALIREGKRMCPTCYEKREY